MSVDEKTVMGSLLQPATKTIVDADRHVIEPFNIWEQYLPLQFHDYIPYLQENKVDGDNQLLPFYMINGTALMHKWNDNKILQREIAKQSGTVGPSLALAANPESQLASMDKSGIDMALLFPTYTPYIVANDHIPAEVSAAFATAYNNWLFDYCTLDVMRLKGVGFLSRHTPENMLEELNRIINFGWTSVVLRPEKLGRRMLGHADYAPFWDACEKHNIAVAFHGGTHLHAPTAGADCFDSHFALHACAHPHEMQKAFLSLLEAGVFERHPNLKVAFLESGAAWLPHWLWRLDEICYGPLSGEVAENIRIKPSEYFKRQCWIGFEPGEPCLRQVIDMVGADRLLYGSDFPHPDHLHFSFDTQQGENSGFSASELDLILSKNPVVFYGV